MPSRVTVLVPDNGGASGGSNSRSRSSSGGDNNGSAAGDNNISNYDHHHNNSREGGGLHHHHHHHHQQQQQQKTAAMSVIQLEFDTVKLDFPVPDDATLMLSDLRVMIKQQRDQGGFPTSFLFEYDDDYAAGAAGAAAGSSSSSCRRRIRVFQSLECQTPLQQCLLKSKTCRLYLRRTAVEPPPNNPPSNHVVTPVASKTAKKTTERPREASLKGTPPLSSTTASTSATRRSTSLNRGTKRKKTTKPSASAPSKSKKAPPTRYHRQHNGAPKHRLMVQPSKQQPERFEFPEPSTALFVKGEEKYVRKVERILERDYVEDVYNSKRSPASYLYKIEWAATMTTTQTQPQERDGDGNGDGDGDDDTHNVSYTKVAYKNMSADLQEHVRERSWSDRSCRRRSGPVIGSATRHDKIETMLSSSSSSSDRSQKKKDDKAQTKPLSSVVASSLADKFGDGVEKQQKENDTKDYGDSDAQKKYLYTVVASLLDDNLDDEEGTMNIYKLFSSKQEEKFEI